MLTALLSLTTATLFGVGDFLGGFASRKESALVVTANAHVIGFVMFALGVLVLPAPVTTHDLLMGVVSGVSGGLGVGALYAALARGRMSIVAPLTAAISGSLPAVYDFVRGTDVGPLAIVGLVLALGATIIVSANASDETSAEEEAAAEHAHRDMPAAAIGLSLLAGVAFSIGFVSFSLASRESGLWPLAAARLTSMTIYTVLALMLRRTVVVGPGVRFQTLGAGLTDATANVTMITAIRIGPLAVASVLGALYPVVTILLARVVLGERLRGWQRVGVALALVAVLLTALP